MARHMTQYLSLLDLEVRRWSRNTRQGLAAALEETSVVLLLISDGAIADFVERHGAAWDDRLVVHFSGSVTVSGVAGMHPLCTFGPDPYQLDVYSAIPFVYEVEGPRFSDAFPTLPNPSYGIPREWKPRYHAAAVLAGNFSTALWLKLFQVLEELDIPREAAHAYLERTCHNLIAVSPDQVSTGPLARGDARTVGRNLEALSGDPYEAVYRAFVEVLAPELNLESR